jgi:hypothetical protein
MQLAGASRQFRVILVLFVVLVACDEDPQQPAPTGPLAPSALETVVDGSQVRISWSVGANSGTTRIKLLRNLNAAPTGPGDTASTLVYFGPDTEAFENLGSFLPDHEAERKYIFTAYGCDASGACETTGRSDTLAVTLLQCLRGGGYSLYWRHATAQTCEDDFTLGTAMTTLHPGWWRSCNADCDSATARQLTDPNGYIEANALGADPTLHSLAFSSVISSEYCRCLRTAQLVDLGPPIETNLSVSYYVADEPNRCAAVMGLLARIPPAGTNAAMFGHAGFNCGKLGLLAPAECAVLKPDGSDLIHIARVTWNQWPLLP